MKALSDFIAVILFFAVYTATKNMVMATAVAVVVGVIQAAYTLYRYKKMEPMQWVGLVLIVVFGGATIMLKDCTFIMLKTTILTWLVAAVLLTGQLTGKNGLKMLIGREFRLPESVWAKLSYAWILFFAFIGLLNLVIAYPFPAECKAEWVNFKFYGYIPLTVVFSIAQGLYIFHNLPKEE